MRRKFSERIGVKPVKVELQLDSMDNDLRVGLWNVVTTCFFEPATPMHDLARDSLYHPMLVSLWINFFKHPLDSLSHRFSQIRQYMRDWFFNSAWFETYDFIEFISQNPGYGFDRDKFIILSNIILENELSGYRFVDGSITPITDKSEILEIEHTLESTQKTKLMGVHIHLKSALTKLSNKTNPDFRNSIKESISAVEAISQIISGKPKACLEDGLKTIEGKLGLHRALIKGYGAIYGYTSDEGGIRHAMIEEANCDFDDAKYMLVSCSAFVNYLIMKATKAGVKLQ